MSNIFIRAYSQLNLGDDLFVKILCERYPNHKFHLVCEKTKSIAFKDIQNLIIHYSLPFIDSIFYRVNFRYNSFHRISLNIAKECDYIIHIGGSIFIENKNWKNQLNQYNDFINLNKQYYILGCNFGPYTEERYRESYSEIFSLINDICFRDKNSYTLFPELKNSRVAPDVVFTLKNKKKLYKEDNNIIISVINLSNRDRLKKYINLYEKAISELTEKFIENGFYVTLMSFCAKEGDEKSINRIYKNLNKRTKQKTVKYFYRGDINETLYKIKNSKGIIATRFHSLILGLKYKIPTFSMIYSEKTTNVLEELNLIDNSILIEKIEEINLDKIISLFGNKKDFINIGEYINEAEEQFFELDKELL